MALNRFVNIRLTPEKYFIYNAQATDYGLSVSSYLRKRLEEQDIISQQLHHLYQAIQTPKNSSDSHTNSVKSDSSTIAQSNIVQLETLLLLRTLANPGNVNMIQSELKRLGYQPWSPEKNHDD